MIFCDVGNPLALPPLEGPAARQAFLTNSTTSPQAPVQKRPQASIRAIRRSKRSDLL